MDITELLTLSLEMHASDLHLSAGIVPLIRVDGELRPLNLPILAHDEILHMVGGIMNNQQRQTLANQHETDFSFELSQLARFRANVFRQARGIGAVFRIIPITVPTLQTLGLPARLTDIASYSSGLVLVTGSSGSGKSTTLASLIAHVNCTRFQHILTIEDPIEFVHEPQKCLISQRELHRDTLSFTHALRSALREDPDIILIGELRDAETIRLAMTAAETGHLVLATLHTNSATKTVNRIIDAFRGEEKAMIRSMLAESLQAVIAQTLVRKIGGGRILAFELMLCNPAIRNLIREDKVAQMYSTIQTGQAQGMQTLDQHLTQLTNNNLISKQDACNLSSFKSVFAH